MIVRSFAVVGLLFAVACSGSNGDNTPDGGLPDSGVPGATCSMPIASSSLPAAQVQSLGVKTVGSLVTFDVPAGTSSITVLHQAKSANLTVTAGGHVIDNSAVPATIKEPNGTVVYDDNACDGPAPDGGAPPSCTGWTDPEQRLGYFGGGTPVTGALTVPNTTAALNAATSGWPAGKWSFVVNDYAYECSAPGSGCTAGSSNSNTYDVSVLLKPASGGNNLDLAFYIVANVTGTLGPLTASTAPNEQRVQRMVQTYKNIFANQGITVRNVSYYDVSDADRQRYGTSVSADATGPCDNLSQMFTLSSAHPGNVMNVFLVQSIQQSSTQTGGGTVVGLDGTIPGPSTANGTVHSGAAVSLANLFSGTCLPQSSGAPPDLSCGADLVAYIAAHETGHFLGLFHTTESGGNFFDPLSDTPKCPCLSCASASDQAKCVNPPSNAPPILSASLCTGSPAGCDGGRNLMFWQLSNGTSQGTLSSQQAQVMKANPLLQ